MNRARTVPLTRDSNDDLEAERKVVLRADKMSLLDAEQCEAILRTAWRALVADRNARKGPDRIGPSGVCQIIDLAAVKRERRTVEFVVPFSLKRRPKAAHRLTLVPTDPSDPKDAA